MDQVIVISILLRDLEVIDLENCSVLDWMLWFKVFKTPYFLDPWLDSFDTCTAPRYWSKVLPTIIPFPLVTLISKSCTLKIHFFVDLDVLVSRHVSKSATGTICSLVSPVAYGQMGLISLGG